MTRLSTDELLAKIRRRENLTASEQTSLVIRLSVPAVLAEISTILMEYIDAAMVGHLGAQASAAVSVVMPRRRTGSVPMIWPGQEAFCGRPW